MLVRVSTKVSKTGAFRLLKIGIWELVSTKAGSVFSTVDAELVDVVGKAVMGVIT